MPTKETDTAFLREIPVRFCHCDPGGWVFYPRYLEMISCFVEEWFEDALRLSLWRLGHTRQVMTPTVHLGVDFAAPSRFGDRLTSRLWVVKLGRSSCELRIELSKLGQLRLTAHQVLVFIDARRERAVAIPPALAQRMRRFLLSR